MSVILTSGKAAAAKLRQGKKKPKKVTRPRTAMPVDSYLPTAETAVWNAKIGGIHYSVAFSKDSLEVWCNDQLIDTVNDFSDTGSTVDFELASKKARIAITPGPKGTSYELSLDGEPVVAARPPDQKHQREPKQLSASCDGALGLPQEAFGYDQLP